MKRLLQIVSDIHLEYQISIPKLNVYADNLALLGDIGYPSSSKYYDFIKTCSTDFKNVFLILGNHEYYSNLKISQTEEYVENLIKNFPNVHLLNRKTYTIDDTIFVGCTLWSNISVNIVNRINDFRQIPELTYKKYIEMHNLDVAFIKKQLDGVKNKKMIVLTHYAPLLEMNGVYQGNDLNSGFATDLTCLFKSPIIAWGSGHVHSNCDINVNGIRSVSNAIGYFNESDVGYRENTIIEF
jgi:predicted phosphohydrolase